MTDLETLVWVDGVDSTCTPPELRCLSQGRDGLSQVRCPMNAVRRRRAFEPSHALFNALPSRSVRFHVDLADLRVAGRLGTMLPKSLARLRATAHRLFIAEDSNPPLLIPAVLLIEALWMWSERAARQLMIPGSLDLMVGRVTADGRSRVASAMLSPERGPTELRRVAWLGQDDTARQSWESVYTHAIQGRVALDMPRARLKGWAWGVELTHGMLVAEFDALVLEFELPTPGAKLQLGRLEIQVPPAPEPAKGLPTFL